MFAIIKIGGKQYKVSQGDTIYVEKVNLSVDEKLTINDVLMVNGKVGSPYVDGAFVTASVTKQGKQKKIDVIKFKSKKHYLKRYGHRQPYTKLTIDSIKG